MIQEWPFNKVLLTIRLIVRVSLFELILIIALASDCVAQFNFKVFFKGNRFDFPENFPTFSNSTFKQILEFLLFLLAARPR
jgi:hypothetical protein